jgi:hypothetical protein
MKDRQKYESLTQGECVSCQAFASSGILPHHSLKGFLSRRRAKLVGVSIFVIALKLPLQFHA